MSSLTRHGRLKFDTADIDGKCSDNIGVFLRDGYGLQLTSTEIDGYTQALDVNIKGPVNEDGYLMVSLQDADIIVDVDINQYAEDSAHATGDLGDFMLSVKLSDLEADNSAQLAGTNGDYQALFTNDKGELYVTDKDAYGALLDVILGLDNISFDPAISTPDGYLYVTVTNPTPSASEYAEDSVHVTADTGVFDLSIRLDDLTADNSAQLAGTNGDYQGFFTNAKGEQYVTDKDAYGALQDIIIGLDDISFSPTITNPDGYLLVEITGTPIQVDTISELEIADCPLIDGYTGSQSFIGDSHRRLWVNNTSGIAGKVSAVAVSNTAALLLSGGALDGRTRILLQNKGAEVVYVGFDNTVTADDLGTGGFELGCNDVLSLEISDCINLWAITPTATGATVKVVETA